MRTADLVNETQQPLKNPRSVGVRTLTASYEGLSLKVCGSSSSIFGGNDESKKMQKYLLKQQFKSFYVSNSEGLHKGYDRFQSLLSQLETHGVGVSTEDADQKFLRSLPSSWSQVSLIMRTNLGVDTLNFDDLYNNLRVFESDVKGSTGSSSSTQIVHLFLLKTLAVLMKLILLMVVLLLLAITHKRKALHHTLMILWRKLHFDSKETVGFDKSKLSASIATIPNNFLESADQKGIKTVEGEMQETLDTRQRIMERDLQNRMNIKLWSLLIEKAQTLSQMSAKDKSGLGYGSQIHDGVLSYENKVFASVFNSRSSDVEDSHVNDRFAKVEGMHAVPPLMTRNYMPPKSDFSIDESKFTYGPKQSTTISNEPKAISEPKVWSDAPIIEEYESDSDDEPNFTSQAALSSTARKINTARPKVHDNRPRHNVYKSHSPIRRPLQTPSSGISILLAVGTPSTGSGNLYCQWELSPGSGNALCILFPTIMDNPHQTLKGKGIVDSRCSGHMTGNKAYLVDYQDFHGSPIAFGGSKGQISGKGKQHKASCKAKVVSSISQRLLLLHMDLFGPTSPITLENKANHTAGKKETNNSVGTRDAFDARNSDIEANRAQEYYVLPIWSSYTSTVKRSKEKNGDAKLNEKTNSKINEESIDKKDQAFLEELERIKSQDKEATDAVETLRKMFAQSTEDLLLQAGAARASSTNFFNTATTPLNAASTPTNQDDSQIPALEDIYDHSMDGIFTSASYDDEGTVADIINLEITVYRNKKDERGVVVRNKARLAVQVHRQEEGIDYDEVFTPVARIEAISIFLAFSFYMGFIVYQMDGKSALLYGKIDEEVCRRGLIDKTLFINKDKKDIMLVQVYVFGSTKKSWCDESEALMKNRFLMSSMGELTFFLGLQVQQKKD
nr:hypothetical protein [Tanacetum cinerariifolium]